MTRDHEGGYWFSTLDAGIFYTSSLEVVHWLPKEMKNENAIYDINGIGDKIYYSSVFGYFELKSGVCILPKKIDIHRIGVWNNQLMLSAERTELAKKTTWGYETHVFHGWTVKNGRFYSGHEKLFTIGPGGKATVLNDYRLDRIDKNGQPAFIYSLASTESDKLYAGTVIGLFEVVNNQFKKVPLPDDLDGIRITDLGYHPVWGLVAATRGKGIFFFKKGKVTGRIGKRDGLLSDQLNSIHIGKNGMLYVTSNSGISRITLKNRNEFVISNLTDQNGLSSSEVNRIFTNREGVYVSTKNGITLIPSGYIWNGDIFEKQLKIERVFVNGELLKGFKNGMEFNSSQKVIRFLLRTTNYKSFHQRPYKYRFRSSDPWSVGSNGELILINPSFESYQLEVQYQNEYGNWGKPYVLTTFSILPPFYQTWWFMTIVFLCLLGGILLFFRNRLLVIQNKDKMMREIEHLEQKALLAQMNPHFIFNALNSIQSFLLFHENELAERYLLKLSQLIRMTLTNSRESEITIEKEIDVLRKYLELEQMRFKHRFDFDFELTISNKEMQKSIPPMLIQPFVENSVIHGFKSLKAGGLIKISFLKMENGILFAEVRDNGIGYQNTLEKDNTEHKSYGTRITTERLNLFKQKYQGEFMYSIESLVDPEGNVTGTIVRMTIPVI